MLKKAIISYSFLSILTIAIVIPTYIALTENNHQIALITEFGDEEEKNEKNSSEDIQELKILHQNFKLNTQQITYTTSSSLFYLKEYSSNFKVLDSPPPENRI